MSPTSLLALAVILLIAGAALAAFLRRDRDRLRQELRAISLEALARTGDSLAQRVGEARRAEQERAAGEMATRTQEIR